MNEHVWGAVQIDSLFDKFEPGKAKGLNHLKRSVKGPIPYIGATNRNCGVMFFIESYNESEILVQHGDCIGFIKNGDGSAGYAIYVPFIFISTSDVIYGFSQQICDRYSGLYFVTCQDKIKSKYSHAYKREKPRLLNDRVMLPLADGNPDFAYMRQYTRERERALLDRYLSYARKRLAECEFGMSDEFTYNVSDKDWEPFQIADLFTYSSGKENNMADLNVGDIPLISAKNINNGLKGFVSDPKTIVSGHCITLNKDGDGGAGLAYYQPADMALDTHVIALRPKDEMSRETLIFIARCMSMLHDLYGHGLSISEKRLTKTKFMLPIDPEGQPDYKFMEEYVREREYRKLETFIRYIRSRTDA